VSQITVKFEPDNVRGLVGAGVTVHQAATALGVPMDAPCGGSGRCGKCRCFVREGEVELLGDQRAKLGDEEFDAGMRLACLTVLRGDATIEIAPSARVARQQILEEAGLADAAFEIEPCVTRHALALSPPTLDDQRSDFERLADALAEEGVALERARLAPLLAELPAVLRADGFRVTATVAGGRLVAVEAGHSAEHLYGVAFDIGTTSIVGYLADLTTGRQLAAASRLNPQVAYGDDVVSRITHIQEHEDGVAVLKAAAVGALAELLQEVSAECGVPLSRVSCVTLVGNAAMSHLAWGIDPRHIAQAPYVPVVRQAVSGEARDLGLPLAPLTPVFGLPNIAGWLGADTVGVILALDQHRAAEPAIAIDIGTNGEIVVGDGRRMIACSAAAGPAFEGAQIHRGMRAADGAIDHVGIFDGVLKYTTIGGAPARGICGSGLLDIAAALVTSGCVNDAGVMLRADDDAAQELPQDLSRRLTEEDGRAAFIVAPADEAANGVAVCLTQADVRQIQLAKGAIAAGIHIALSELSLEPSDIAAVHLAGAFGNYVRPESAAAIGLFPPELAARARGVGNAAGAGAYLALLSQAMRDEASRVVEHVEYLELATRLDFNMVFADCMMFPEPA
jgi:uncharacterized 2Fe-2S/4Fe-4S cluster protein (DUF4445 family)